jgi:hypothetical protein
MAQAGQTNEAPAQGSAHLAGAVRSDGPHTAVRARGLSKRYGTTVALDGLDLTVARGEVYGCLGPNGAGRTTTIMFLALGFLALALLPRAAVGLAYGLVSVAFVWELFGSLLGAPHWLVELSPFQHVGLGPAQSLRASAAAVMLAVATAATIAAGAMFRGRDLVGR